jgi:glucose-6-phosphate 1-epimerase
VGTDAATTIIDPVLGRRIRIAKRGSSSTVVWNPGPERAARMPDVGAGHWRGFVCVETSNAGPDIIRLVPGARHVLAAEYEVAGEGASAR